MNDESRRAFYKEVNALQAILKEVLDKTSDALNDPAADPDAQAKVSSNFALSDDLRLRSETLLR